MVFECSTELLEYSITRNFDEKPEYSILDDGIANADP